jgi:hypothetical protein
VEDEAAADTVAQDENYREESSEAEDEYALLADARRRLIRPG